MTLESLDQRGEGWVASPRDSFGISRWLVGAEQQGGIWRAQEPELEAGV